MKLIILLWLTVSAISAPPDVRIVKYTNENNGLGDYRFRFEQSDGTKHEQEGEIKNKGQEDEALVVKGSYSWVGPDNFRYTVTYVADENGYRSELKRRRVTNRNFSAALTATLLG